MKIIPAVTLLAVTAAFATPKTQANEETRALIGGLIGGIIIGSVIADDTIHTSVNVSYNDDSDRGYYEWISVRTWVPGYYERRCDRYGNSYKAWIPGYNTYVKQKVWVEGRRSCRIDRRYQYNNRRRDNRHYYNNSGHGQHHRDSAARRNLNRRREKYVHSF